MEIELIVVVVVEAARVDVDKVGLVIVGVGTGNQRKIIEPLAPRLAQVPKVRVGVPAARSLNLLAGHAGKGQRGSAADAQAVSAIRRGLPTDSGDMQARS